jgi:hypothetical protein
MHQIERGSRSGSRAGRHGDEGGLDGRDEVDKSHLEEQHLLGNGR